MQISNGHNVTRTLTQEDELTAQYPFASLRDPTRSSVDTASFVGQQSEYLWNQRKYQIFVGFRQQDKGVFFL
jgi:hypothetical protein